MGSEYEPFRVGGQPLFAEIEMWEGADKKRYYRTQNTLHPIVLQENLLQIEILLKSLCLSYYQYNSNISTLIAVDIWSQLSDYAKDTIINHFECENEELLAFVQSINDDCPDDHICNYQTQREMMENADATTSDILCDAVKLSHRRYSLKYKKYDGIIIHLQHVKIEKRNATEFVAVDENGNEYCFREEWINSIIKE